MPEKEFKQPCHMCRFGPNGNSECDYIKYSFEPTTNENGLCISFQDKASKTKVQEISSDTFLRKGFSKT